MSSTQTDVADEHQALLFDVWFYQLAVNSVASKTETGHWIQSVDVLLLLKLLVWVKWVLLILMSFFLQVLFTMCNKEDIPSTGLQLFTHYSIQTHWTRFYLTGQTYSIEGALTCEPTQAPEASVFCISRWARWTSANKFETDVSPSVSLQDIKNSTGLRSEVVSFLASSSCK